MDFAVATVRCFDTVKVHHDKRWLRQQRLLCISTNEVLNCPWPTAGSKAMQLFELFSKPIEKRKPSQQQQHSPPVPQAAVAAPITTKVATAEDIEDDPQHTQIVAKVTKSPGSKSTPLHLLMMSQEMNQLEQRYQRAREIILGSYQSNTGNPNNVISFEDIKKIFNPSKCHPITDVTGTSLKGDDHLCINFKTDHPYFYNTPLAIDISKLIRARFIAWSSAKLVQGNFVLDQQASQRDVANELDATNIISNFATTVNPDDSPRLITPDTAAAAGSSSTTGSRAVSPRMDPKDLSLMSSSSPASSSPTTPQPGPIPLQNGGQHTAGQSRVAELFQSGVIELPTNSDVDHLQPQVMLLTKALDWIGGATPASVMVTVSSAVQKLAEDTASWSAFEATFQSGEQTQAQKQKVIDAASSPVSRARAQSRVVVGTPTRALEFRERFNSLRCTLVENYLVSGSNEIVEPEKSISERFAFWRSPKRIPQFEDASDAELVAELALQNLLFRNAATLKNLWADISVAFHDEMELFGFNCKLLSAPCVPFAYFGIPADFETVRFDLVRFHLSALTSCKTPSSMLNAIVSAIKSVIVCIKARHVLSKRWSRASSLPPALMSSGSSNNNNNHDNNAASASSTESLMASSSNSAGYWTRAELDQIASESKKHSLYNTDDILPIFIYIIVHCDLPQLLLYHRFLEILSFDGEASERSFYVTVFFSAIQWVLDWKKPVKGKNRRGRRANSTSINNNSSFGGIKQKIDLDNSDDDYYDDDDDDDDFAVDECQLLPDEVWDEAAAVALAASANSGIGNQSILSSASVVSLLQAANAAAQNNTQQPALPWSNDRTSSVFAKGPFSATFRR